MAHRKLIIESQYFPCIAWMTVACSTGEIWIDHAENYNKRSLRNKTWLSQTDNQVALSIPLKKGKHGGTNIGEISISNQENWRTNHMRAIQSIYGKSPYFIHYIDRIQTVLQNPESHLLAYTTNIIVNIVECLSLDVDFKEQHDFVKSSSNSIDVLRDQFKYTGEYSSIESILEENIRKMDGFTHLPFLLSPRSSILDLLFYLGPETRLFLNSIRLDKVFEI